MSSILSGLAGIAEKSGEQALAFGLGLALGSSLEPAGVTLRQEAWGVDPIRAPDWRALAGAVAGGKVDEGAAAGWAKQQGLADERWDALIAAERVGPAFGQAMTAWRRGVLSDGDFTRALTRAGLEPEWFAAMRALKAERLDPGAIATAVHRGIMAGGGLIVREPPLGAGKIPHVAQSDLSAVDEFAAHGIDPERGRILVGNTGLPLALGEMLALLNRGEVTEDDVRRAIAQSNTRNEYMDVALELRRQLPTARDYLENALRGYRSLADALEGAALHGMTEADATMIYQNQGRPMAVRLITQALARGGKFKPEPGEITDPYEASIVEGSLKPAYYDLAKALRYTLPSAFVIRGLAQAKDISRDEAETLLLESGWEPTLAKKVAGQWATGGTGGGKAAAKAELGDEYEGGYITEAEYRAELAKLGYTGDELELEVNLGSARRLKRWREKIVDAIAAAYLGYRLDDTSASSELAEVNVTGEAATMLLHLWGIQRRDTVKLLTAAQVAKAFKKGLLAQDAALERLEELGYSASDAAILLQE